MLNENTERVLDIILRECGNGYKILTDEDFSSVMGYAEIIDNLSDSGYVAVRYSSGGEYLVAPTYKARCYFEEKQKRETEMVYKAFNDGETDFLPLRRLRRLI